jgi:hypothetical protein
VNANEKESETVIGEVAVEVARHLQGNNNHVHHNGLHQDVVVTTTAIVRHVEHPRHHLAVAMTIDAAQIIVVVAQTTIRDRHDPPINPLVDRLARPHPLHRRRRPLTRPTRRHQVVQVAIRVAALVVVRAMTRAEKTHESQRQTAPKRVNTLEVAANILTNVNALRQMAAAVGVDAR